MKTRLCADKTYRFILDFIKICIYIYIYITSEYITYVTQEKCLDPLLFFYTNTSLPFDDNLRRAAAAAFRRLNACGVSSPFLCCSSKLISGTVALGSTSSAFTSSSATHLCFGFLEEFTGFD